MSHRLLNILTLAIFAGFTAFPAHYVYAQEGAQSQAPADVTAKEQEINDAKKKALNNKLLDISKGLGQKELAHFMVIYSSYAVINMVKDVQSDVSGAVKACIETNPDMKSKIENRYQDWNKSIGTSMEEAQANVNNMALAQNYIPQSDLKALNALVGETRMEAGQQFQKIPVTTPEACEFMLTKMDDTQATMTVLLGKTIENFAEVIKKTQE